MKIRAGNEQKLWERAHDEGEERRGEGERDTIEEKERKKNRKKERKKKR